MTIPVPQSEPSIYPFIYKKPLTCSDKNGYPSLPSNVYWGKKFLLSLPFSIFNLVHVQLICFFSTDEQLFTRTAFT